MHAFTSKSVIKIRKKKKYRVCSAAPTMKEKDETCNVEYINLFPANCALGCCEPETIGNPTPLLSYTIRVSRWSGTRKFSNDYNNNDNRSAGNAVDLSYQIIPIIRAWGWPWASSIIAFVPSEFEGWPIRLSPIFRRWFCGSFKLLTPLREGLIWIGSVVGQDQKELYTCAAAAFEGMPRFSSSCQLRA